MCIRDSTQPARTNGPSTCGTNDTVVPNSSANTDAFTRPDDLPSRANARIANSARRVISSRTL